MKDSFARPARGYIPTLDGWRTVAIMGVMLIHGGPLLPSHRMVYQFQTLGASGVELFFAISGILICGRLLDEEASRGRISLRDFYLRRLFRIQPAALVYLLALVPLAAAGMFPFSAPAWVTSVFSVRNLYRAPHLDDGSIYTAHFWSLAIEEHFYLILPWLLVLLPGRHRLRWLGVVAGLGLAANYAMERTPIARMAVNSEFELCWLFLASWIALLLRHEGARRWLARCLPAGPVIAVVGAIGVGVALKWRFVWHLWFPALPLVVVATMLHPESVPGRILEWGPMRWIGRISYSLYLWQTLFCMTIPGVPHANWPLGWMQQHPQCYLLPFPCALASYFFVEKPFLALGKRLMKRGAGLKAA